MLDIMINCRILTRQEITCLSIDQTTTSYDHFSEDLLRQNCPVYMMTDGKEGICQEQNFITFNSKFLIV